MPCNHKAFSKQRWALTQKAEMDLLSKHKCLQHITNMRHYARERYMPHIEPYCNVLTEHSHILEVACGATCLASEIPQGRKVFLDPLLDFFRRELPGSLPDLPDKQVLAIEAERMSLDSKSFDFILCLCGISHMYNPELVLHEIERILKEEGVFILSVVVWPVWMSRLYYRLSPFVPKNLLKNRLYCYAPRGIRKTLARHFEITSETTLPIDAWYSLKRELFFVCKYKRL
ncbi:MAG: methyltransferase domain-containing protein [Mariprofundaceae bacterium]|nr:methyltransferase domain-containing protein [Mariprofundaceae bacterium]